MSHPHFGWLLLWAFSVHAASPAELLAEYSAQAGQVAQAERGQRLFTTSHGRPWQCTSCHGTQVTQAGRHASTHKTIEALAPSANAQRLTDRVKVEKWFRRNCKDVLDRECSALEKADVMAWLISVR